MLGYLRGLRVYDGFASLILAKGEWFHGRANAADYEITRLWAKQQKPRAKDCYYNAQQFCINCGDFRYLEGYVLIHPIDPMEHAWVVMDDGRIVDFTLEAMERKAKKQHKLVVDTSDALYLGVEVPRLFVMEHIVSTDNFESVAELFHASNSRKESPNQE
jgi:hypothetical protein